MQGIKEYQEKFFVNFRLSELVLQGNFYRRLKETLDLSYLRRQTAKYYGTEGQKSIDTEVFFKLMLIGYLENINSDRKIVETAGMRIDMLYFLGYDIDEPEKYIVAQQTLPSGASKTYPPCSLPFGREQGG